MRLQQSSARIEWIDIAKGVGIFYVMLSHSQLGVLVNHAGSFFMPLFFFLSGYVFKRHDNYKYFITKKFKSLIIPYITLSVILYLVYLFNLLIQGTTITFNTLVYPIVGSMYSRYYLFNPEIVDYTQNVNLMTIQNGPLWFLTALFVMEVIFYFLTKLNKKGFYFGLVLCTIIGIVISKYFVILMPWSVDTALTCIIFFVVGFIIKNKNIQIHSYKTKFGLLFAFLVINLIFIQLNSYVNISIAEYGNYIYFYLAAFSGVGVYILLSQYIEKFSKRFNMVLSYMGKNSLVLLGFHLIAFNDISNVFTILDINLLFMKDSLIYGLIYTILATIILIPVIFIINNIIPWVLGKNTNWIK